MQPFLFIQKSSNKQIREFDYIEVSLNYILGREKHQKLQQNEFYSVCKTIVQRSITARLESFFFFYYENKIKIERE